MVHVKKSINLRVTKKHELACLIKAQTLEANQSISIIFNDGV